MAFQALRTIAAKCCNGNTDSDISCFETDKAKAFAALLDLSACVTALVLTILYQQHMHPYVLAGAFFGSIAGIILMLYKNTPSLEDYKVTGTE